MKKSNNFLCSTLCNLSGHIAKRDDIAWWKAWLVRIVAVLIALVVCGGITIALTDIDPVSMYMSMIDGAIGTERLTWNLIQNIAILLCVSLFKQNPRIASFDVSVKPELRLQYVVSPLLAGVGDPTWALLGLGRFVCFKLKSFSWSPAAWLPPKRNGMSNLNTNGRKQDSFPSQGELECLHQKGCLLTWCSFTTLFGANTSL